MRSGRDVQFSAILLSCIAVLCHRAGAFGIEQAVGSCARTACDACSIHPYSSYLLSGARAHVSFFTDSPCPSFHPDVPDRTVSAMALPDGPGAVCFGVVGFICVSLIKNRRIWIGLCLCLLSHGRTGAARLSKMGVPGPRHAGFDAPGESDPEQLLRCESTCRSRRLPDVRRAAVPCVPVVSGFNPGARRAACGGSHDDLCSAWQPPLAQAAFEKSRMARLVDVGWSIVDRSACDACVQRARPPPGAAQTNQDETELSSDFHLLAQQRRKR